MTAARSLLEAKPRATRCAIVLGMVAAITAGHYTLALSHLAMHDVMQRLYYLPIVLAGLWFGLRGGLAVSVLVAIVYLPHIFIHWGGVHAHNAEKFLELVLFVAVGTLTGKLSARQRETNAELRKAYGSLRTQSKELLDAQEQLGHAERLAALGELSAELAHEIRNPLGAIRGAAEIFRDRLPQEHELREFALMLCKEAQRLDGVVESCLGIARPRASVEPGDVAAALGDVLALTAAQARAAGVEVACRLPPELPRVAAPPGSLRQVFMNLALNAIQAMPRGGTLEVLAAVERGAVRVRFADTGRGLAPEDVGRVFQPFFSRRDRGTGLGLTISQRLVASSGGRIEVASELGKGSAFTVELPAGAQEA